MAEEVDRTEHFQWLVDARDRNQRCSLKLRLLLKEHEKRWKTKQNSMGSQELISVSFSLWRAVFLAEKTGKRSAVFDDGLKFIERVIEDNAIAYAQDKAMREWSFNYYTRAARYSLEFLHNSWPGVCPAYVKATRMPKKRWEYCQTLLEKAVEAFGAHFEAPPLLKVPKSGSLEKARPKKQTKANRQVVRQLSQGTAKR